jgi:excisionase family DNA binding protein
MAQDDGSGDLTIGEAAERAGVSRRVLDHAIRRGRLPVRKDSRGRRRVRPADLTIFAQSRSTGAAARVEASRPEPSDLDGAAGGEAADGTGAPPSAAAESGTLQMLRATLRELREELALKDARIDALEQQLQHERSRHDEERRSLLAQLDEANSFVSEAGSGRAFDAIRAREFGRNDG